MDIREGTIQGRLLACTALKLIVVMARVVTVCRGQSGTIFKKGGGSWFVVMTPDGERLWKNYFGLGLVTSEVR